MTEGLAGLTKAWVTLRAREVAALGREMLGGNGILADYLVAKHFGDMETMITGEGTYEINSLVAAREFTGIPAFLASSRSPSSKL